MLKGLAGSHVIFSSVEHAARKATLMVTDRVTVFDQPPKMLTAAECAAHRHFASSEHDEIACLGAELGFQVAASRRARELYAGLYAHRNTPLLACRMSKLPRWRENSFRPRKKNRFAGVEGSPEP